MAQEAELLPSELALGDLGIELPTTEDLQRLLNVERVLPQRRQVHKTVHQRAPAQLSSTPPWIGGRSARSGERGVVAVPPSKSRPT